MTSIVQTGLLICICAIAFHHNNSGPMPFPIAKWIYRIYPYKRPLLINPRCYCQPLQSSYFGVLHPSQQPKPLPFRIKKRCFSTSPIE